MPGYAEYKRALLGRRLPAAFVDLDLFDANVAEVRRRAGGKRTAPSVPCGGSGSRRWNTACPPSAPSTPSGR